MFFTVLRIDDTLLHSVQSGKFIIDSCEFLLFCAEQFNSTRIVEWIRIIYYITVKLQITLLISIYKGISQKGKVFGFD